VEVTEERWWEAELNRVAGEIALMPSKRHTTKAEAYFERALAVARKQQAKSWELRAAMSMARLWRVQGKREEARNLLAPVYGWFTEGFDTLDLKEAKALLDECAGANRTSSSRFQAPRKDCPPSRQRSSLAFLSTSLFCFLESNMLRRLKPTCAASSGASRPGSTRQWPQSPRSLLAAGMSQSVERSRAS
jgi:hypothetical protein